MTPLPALLLLFALGIQEGGEVERIMLRFHQRREKAATVDAYARLLADTREELERYLKSNPNAADAGRAAFHAAETRMWGRDFKTGAEKLRTFLKEYPDSESAPAARFALGEVLLFQLEDDAGARAAFEDFARLHPKDERALFARLYAATCLQNEGKYEEAAAALTETRQAFKDRKESWSAPLQLAILYHAQEKNEEARRTLEQIIRDGSDPGMADMARRHLTEYLKVGKESPGFSEKDILGNDVSLEKLRGKVVVLYFFDSLAGFAPMEAAFIRRAAEVSKKDEVQPIGISIDLDRRDAETYRKELKIGWPVLCDGRGFDGKIARLHDVRGLPALTVIDRKGKVRFFNIAGKDLLRAVAKLLEEK